MKSIVLLFLVFVAGALAQESPKKLKVAVYYETLCGDSKRFIRSQLGPVKKSAIGNHFDVELVPYGKASTVKVSPTSYSFECQHGKPECDGNKMHACAIKHIDSPELAMDFIRCSMSTSYPPTSLSECSQKLEIDSTKIKACSDSFEGEELLAANGNKTHALSPKLYFVPWITFNGEFTEDNLQNSQSNFKNVVCDELSTLGVNESEC